MTAVRNLSLSCCLLCAMAGVVRMFWPENGFKPVINTVLALYIVASVLPMALDTDWAAVAGQLRGWARGTATAVDYSGYAAILGQRASATALQEQLTAAGIDCTVTVTEQGCTVTLRDAAVLAQAQALVAVACGDMPYWIQGPQQGGGLS